MSFNNFVVPFVVVGVFTALDVSCGDSSYMRQADRSYNWAISSNLSSLKTTTPWPALGSYNRNRHSNSNVNLPSWAGPAQQPAHNYAAGISHQTSYAGNSPNPATSSVANSLPLSPGPVTDQELRDFSETLLRNDVNNAARYVTINLQRKTTSRSTVDEAPEPLMSISREAFNIKTIAKIIPLHDNYIVASNVNEEYTSQEKAEEEAFLDAVLATSVMQHTRDFLYTKGAIGRDLRSFKDALRVIWFDMYPRGGGRVGSSGFEHVFLSEVKKGQISGLHNWLYFNEEELKNQANYLGYMRSLDLGNRGAIVKFHFTFQGIDKPVASMFIGTSPELEMALYSTCFLLRSDKVCPLNLNGHRLSIRTFSYKYRGKSMIGSAFPDI